MARVPAPDLKKPGAADSLPTGALTSRTAAAPTVSILDPLRKVRPALSISAGADAEILPMRRSREPLTTGTAAPLRNIVPASAHDAGPSTVNLPASRVTTPS